MALTGGHYRAVTSTTRQGDLMDRRAMLQSAAGLIAASLGAGSGRAAETQSDWKKPILAYLASLARPDGGFGWDDQADSHLTPTFAAIGCYHLLEHEPPGRKALAEYVRTHHPITGEAAEAGKHASELRSFIYQQIQSLLWIGADASEFRATVEAWRKPSAYPLTYERHGYPVFQQETMAFLCRELLGMPIKPGEDIAPALIEYLDSRRRPNGSFNNTPAADGSDGHVMNTWRGLRSLKALGRAGELREATVAWLRACQLPGGGFSYMPNPKVAGIDDVAWTWAAVRSLELLDAAPANREACARWLRSLWNDDGGFGDRPGLPSRPEAAYFALDALRALNATAGEKRRAKLAVQPPASGLKVFTIQIEAQGNGSPIEAVELARALRIDLWGAKNARPEWIAAAQAVAKARSAPVTFFVANEEYGTFIAIPGQGVYSHTVDLVAPAGVDFGRPLAGPRDNPWEEFRQQRIEPLEAARGRMIWQICDNEEFARYQLDDSVERGGYAAISSVHFAQNFVWMLPFLMRYRRQIPIVALQDAHGGEAWWWADDLTGYRTLFLAEEPTWEGWLRALERQWVAAARHDAVTRYRTRLIGGGPGVQEVVRAREAQWKWWGDRPDDLRRPLVSLAALRPDDEFEQGRPERGIALRVRCWWEGRQWRERPVVELVSLEVDGEAVKPELIERRELVGKVRRLIDVYHRHVIPAPAPGRHTATVTVRRLDTRREAKESIEFQAS
jgi:hypothetical protein